MIPDAVVGGYQGGFLSRADELDPMRDVLLSSWAVCVSLWLKEIYP